MASEIIESHPHISHSEPGTNKGYIKNGEYKIKSKKLDDGSLIQPITDARNSIKKMLERSGHDKDAVLRAMHIFDNAPENERVELLPGLEIVNWPISKLELDLNSAQLMNPLIPAKTAYEFIACHLSGSIYEEVRQLNEIRDQFMKCELNPDVIQVERLTSNKYRTISWYIFRG